MWIVVVWTSDKPNPRIDTVYGPFVKEVDAHMWLDDHPLPGWTTDIKRLWSLGKNGLPNL